MPIVVCSALTLFAQAPGVIITIAGGYIGDGGPAPLAGLNQPSGIARATDGSLYIADAANHRIRKVGADGNISTIAGTGISGFSGDGGPATLAQLWFPRGLALAADGSLYLADSFNNRIRRIGPDGSIGTVAGTGASSFSGDGGKAAVATLATPNGIALDKAGRLFIADTNNHRIRVIGTDGNIATVAGSGSAGFGGDSGPATTAKVNSPSKVAVADDGAFYIADSNNYRVRLVAPDGKISTLAGSGARGSGGDGGPATGALFIVLRDMALASDGSLYIADWQRIRLVGTDGKIKTVVGNGGFGNDAEGQPAIGSVLAGADSLIAATDGTLHFSDAINNRVRRLVDGKIFTIAGTGGFGGDGDQATGDSGPATSAKLSGPAGIVVGDDLNLYLADRLDQRIRKIGGDGTISTLAGVGSFGVGADGGPATRAPLYLPSGLARAGDGTLYFSDYNRIRTAKAGGAISTLAGTGTLGFSGDGGRAGGAWLNFPQGAAVGTDGTIYIADTGNHRIRAVGTDGIISTIAGTGSSGYSGDGGPAVNATLNSPNAVAVGPGGTLFIVDSSNYRIRRVGLDGIISTVAGSGQCCFGGDGGPATSALIGYDYGLAAAPDGALYLADTGNNRIRRIGSDGRISTVAGSGATGFGGDGGAAISAQLNGPQGVAVGPDGALYISDTGNNRIRRVGLAATPAPTLSIVSGNNQSAAINANFGQPLVVKVTTTNGAPGSLVQVQFSATSGAATLSALTATTDGNGLAQVTLKAGATIGPLSVTAIANGASVVFAETVAGSSITNSAPPAFQWSIGGVVPPPQFLTISSSPSGAAFTVSVTSGSWLSISAKSGITPVTLTVTASVLGLKQATNYSGSIAITSGGTTINVPVTLTVTGSTSTDPGSTSTLKLLSGTVNGQPLSTSNPSVTVPPGVALTGSFTVQANSSFASNAVMAMGATPNWGAHRTSFTDLGGFATPGTVNKTVPVTWTAPTTPGTYYIAAAYQGEFTGEQVMSLTNWAAGNASWDDGMDVADWTAATMESAISSGNVQSLYQQADGVHVRFVPATAIRVIVAPATATTRISLRSTPPGSSILVDGVAKVTPFDADWIPGSTHTLDVSTPQGTGSTRYTFNHWSQGGAKSQTITAPSAAATYTAVMTTQYQLWLGVSPGSSGTIIRSPFANDLYYDENTPVQLTASASNGYTFSNFSSDLSGSTSPQTITMSGPRQVLANFITSNQTITGPSVVPRGIVDGSTGSAYLYQQKLKPGDQIVSVQFFNNDVSNSNWITPLLLTASGSSYKIVGIGQSRRNVPFGIQYSDFSVQAGTDVVPQGDAYFGWWNGRINGTSFFPNQGVIQFDSTTSEPGFRESCSTGNSNICGISPSNGLSVPFANVYEGPSDGTLAAPNGRVYSVQITTMSGVVTPTAVVVDSTPTGQSVVVDGAAATTPQNLSWIPGTTHTLDVPTPQGTGGTRYGFDHWTQGGAKLQTITASSAATTYTAVMIPQYLLTSSVAPAGTGTILATPSSPDGYYADSAQVRLTATANSGFAFTNFSGDLNGAISPQILTMSGPKNITANFASNATKVTVTSSPAGRSLLVDGTLITTPQDFNWAVSSAHTLEVQSPQGLGSTRYAFDQWSNGGGRSQTITTPSSPATYSASFIAQYFLTTTVTPATGGTLSINPFSTDGFFTQGTQLTLTAAPASGFTFAGFSSDVTGSASPQKISIAAPINVTATFTAVVPLTATPTQLSLSATQGATTTAPLQMDGGAPGQTVTVTADQPWLKVAPQQGVTPFAVNVVADASNLAVGSYSGKITIGGTKTVIVSFQVTTQASTAYLVASNILATGIQLNVFVGSPLPQSQRIDVTSSNGSALTFSAAVEYGATGKNWLNYPRGSQSTPGSLNIGVLSSGLGQPGTYTAVLVVSATGSPNLRIPVTLSYVQPTPPKIQIDLQEIPLHSAGDVQRYSVIVKNSGPGALPFSASAQSDDGAHWLTVSPGSSTVTNEQQIPLQVTADPAGLSPGTYTGMVKIVDINQQSAQIRVVFAVNPGSKLTPVLRALNLTIGASYVDFPPQQLELLASGSKAVTWTASADSSWIRLTPPNGVIQPAATPGGPAVTFDFSQFQANSVKKGLITIKSDSLTGDMLIPVEVRVAPAGVPVSRLQPTGVVFVAPFVQESSVLYVPSTPTSKLNVISTEWLKVVDQPSTGTAAGSTHTLRVRIDPALFPPNQNDTPVYGVITILEPNNGGSATVTVLAYQPSAASGKAGARKSRASSATGCTPSALIPLATSFLPKFDQSGGGATSTEIVIIDDCGNPVTSGVAGGALGNLDPQLNLRPLGDGRWKATWIPVTPNSFVTLSILGADPDNGLYSTPVQAISSITGAPTGPVLDKAQPFETEAGERLPALAPNLQFRIRGQNFLNADGSAPVVTIGGRALQVISATPAQMVVLTPTDLPPNVESFLVIQAASGTSVPEPLVVAANWPVMVSSEGNSAIVTGIASPQRLMVHGSGKARMLRAERFGPGLWRVELDQPARGVRFTVEK